MILALALIPLAIVSADNHPLHLSSATLVQSQPNEWVLTKTIFTDDLEKAMERAGYEPVRLQDVQRHQEKVDAFLHENLQLFSSGHSPNSDNRIEWRLHTPYTYDPESIQVTISFKAQIPFRVYDGSLLAEFSDQKNVYVVRKNSDEWSQHAIIDESKAYFTVE